MRAPNKKEYAKTIREVLQEAPKKKRQEWARLICKKFAEEKEYGRYYR